METDVPFYIALDASSKNVGFAYSVGDRLAGSGVIKGPKIPKIKFGPKSYREHPLAWFMRSSALAKEVTRVLKTIVEQHAVPYQSVILAIESPYVQQGKTTASVIRALHGVVALIAVSMVDAGLPTENLKLDVNPSTVRKVVSGSGLAKKDITANAVRQCFQFPELTRFASDDESDALALLSHVLRVPYLMPHSRFPNGCFHQAIQL